MACSGGGTDPNPVDIGGVWHYTEEFTDVPHQTTCRDEGTYDLVQSAAGFTGRYFQRGICTGPFGVADNSDSGFVTDGRVAGRTLRFRAPNCEYDGRKTDDVMERLDGHVVCSVGDETITYTFTGTWSAHR
jgi:hypothetical protein